MEYVELKYPKYQGHYRDKYEDNPSNYIYLFKNKISGLTKIGFTEALDGIKQRYNSIRSQSGCELEKVYVFKFNSNLWSSRNYESHLHKKYKKNRGIGEWFDLSVRELTEIYFFMINEECVEIVNTYV